MSNIRKARNSRKLVGKDQLEDFGSGEVAISELELLFAKFALDSALEQLPELLFVQIFVELG